jgi:homoserine kinase
LTQGLKTAKEVAEALKKNISSIGIDFELHISNINNQGIKVIAD